MPRSGEPRVQSVLLIPDRLADWRMWAGLADRLAQRAEVSHLDQLAPLPWDGGSGEVVAAGRAVRPGGWDAVVSAGRAGPFAVSIGAAGLARGIVLAEPE